MIGREWRKILKNMWKDVRSVRKQTDRQKKKAPLNPIQLHYPSGRISVDLIDHYQNMGYDAIMVIGRLPPKMKILIPTTVKLTALGTAELFKAFVFKRFGYPRESSQIEDLNLSPNSSGNFGNPLN